MIPYDDLVAALQAWRARQGLPVAVAAPSAAGPRSAPPPAPAPRTNPPAPPPMVARTPMPLAAPDETHDEVHDGDGDEIDEHALISETHYENEGDDFAMSFAPDGHNGHVSGPEADGSETMVGHDPLEPERPELADPAVAQRSGRDDW